MWYDDMYSNKFYEIVKKNGYEIKDKLVLGQLTVELVKPGCENIFVGYYKHSINEKYFRSEDEIINSILHPVDYEKEFDKIIGWEE